MGTHEFLNEVIHGLSRLHQQHDPARGFEHGHHLLQGLGPHHTRVLRPLRQELIHLRHRAIERADLKGRELND
jgi:hypothetical protein